VAVCGAKLFTAANNISQNFRRKDSGRKKSLTALGWNTGVEMAKTWRTNDSGGFL